LPNTIEKQLRLAKIRKNGSVLNGLHPRRPRGYEPGRRDIFGRKFTSRAEEPLGTYLLTEPVPEVEEFRASDWPEKKNIFLANQRD